MCLSSHGRVKASRNVFLRSRFFALKELAPTLVTWRRRRTWSARFRGTTRRRNRTCWSTSSGVRSASVEFSTSFWRSSTAPSTRTRSTRRSSCLRRWSRACTWGNWPGWSSRRWWTLGYCLAESARAILRNAANSLRNTFQKLRSE